jgi:hypothetical protein
MAQTTQAPAPTLAFVPGSLPPTPRKSNPPVQATSSEPPYHSGADDPEPRAPALARGASSAPAVREIKAASQQDDSRAAPMNLVYAGVPPVSRGGLLDAPTPVSAAPLRQGNEPADSAGAVMISPSAARSSDKSDPSMRHALADRGEGVVAQCLSLLPSSVDKDGRPRLHHEMDNVAGHGEHLDGRGPGFDHRGGDDSNPMSPAEVAMGGEPADPPGGHVQRDFDHDGHPHHHEGHDGRGDFIERPDDLDDFDSGLCGPPPWRHDGVHCHRPHNGGVDENSSYLSPGEFVQAPEPGFLGMASVLIGAMGLRRQRRGK